LIDLRGRFVWLQPLQLTHAPALREIASGPRESFYWANVPQPEGTQAYVERAIAMRAAGQALPFAICTPEGEVIGCTRLFDLQRWEWPGGSDPRPGVTGVYDACEIGFTWLAPRVQRTPVNTEAKLLLLTHAFETWRCFRVTIKTDSRNERSRKAIERLGAKLDGLLRAFQPAPDSKPRTTAYYTILAEEWPDVRSRLTSLLARP
jgi:RimJ/RimL family protein N-acetyltransferase